MVEKIDGRALAEALKDKIAREIFEFKGPRPNLAVILVGSRADSKLYVSLKEKAGRQVGVDTHLYKLSADISEKELLEIIDFLNKDELIDGLLIQLPLPKKFNTNKIIAAIDPRKDVDGFHPQAPDYLLSPVLASILACLDEIKFSGKNKSACIFYNSEVFGSGVKKILREKGMKILPREKSNQADLIVSSLGQAHKIKKEMIKKKAVLIDIGISNIDGKVLGDVDYEDVKEKASYLSPVPGGIGPMTIAFLFKNTLEIFKRKKELKK